MAVYLDVVTCVTCVRCGDIVSLISPSDVLMGYNGTIFAYGQTASGKTHTMEVG